MAGFPHTASAAVAESDVLRDPCLVIRSLFKSAPRWSEFGHKHSADMHPGRAARVKAMLHF
jgi:hypothetical protein